MIDQLLGDNYSSGYAGVWVSEAYGKVIVYRTAASSGEIDEALRARFDTSHMEIATAPYSREYLRGIRDRVDGDRGYWKERGVVISYLAVSPRGEDVEIGVTDEAHLAAVGARYKGLPVRISVVNSVPLGGQR
jgi:hypothetical protein